MLFGLAQVCFQTDFERSSMPLHFCVGISRTLTLGDSARPTSLSRSRACVQEELTSCVSGEVSLLVQGAMGGCSPPGGGMGLFGDCAFHFAGSLGRY